jgi:hypothetical protein
MTSSALCPLTLAFRLDAASLTATANVAGSKARRHPWQSGRNAAPARFFMIVTVIVTHGISGADLISSLVLLDASEGRVRSAC